MKKSHLIYTYWLLTGVMLFMLGIRTEDFLIQELTPYHAIADICPDHSIQDIVMHKDCCKYNHSLVAGLQIKVPAVNNAKKIFGNNPDAFTLAPQNLYSDKVLQGGQVVFFNYKVNWFDPECKGIDKPPA